MSVSRPVKGAAFLLYTNITQDADFFKFFHVPLISRLYNELTKTKHISHIGVSLSRKTHFFFV